MRQFFFAPGHALPEGVAPIGEPVEDMEIVLLGETGAPVPEGATGEIAVRSRYLAAGYWRRPELTAERFLDDRERPGVRLYRTGDLGRFQAGGILEHLGRVDGLAKVRGQRVEAADVESALLALPGVAAAAVTVREDAPGEARLIAYLVPGAAPLPSPTEMRRALAGRLPDFMVPTAFVPLERLPLQRQRQGRSPRAPAAPGGLRAPRGRARAAARRHRVHAGRHLGGRAGRCGRSASATTSSTWAATRCWPPAWRRRWSA